MKYIEERASAINPLSDYEELLKSKKKLRVKLGVDPTAPDVTLGWYAILRASKKISRIWAHSCFDTWRVYSTSWRSFGKIRN
jgi:hypothetical protein